MGRFGARLEDLQSTNFQETSRRHRACRVQFGGNETSDFRIAVDCICTRYSHSRIMRLYWLPNWLPKHKPRTQSLLNLSASLSRSTRNLLRLRLRLDLCCSGDFRGLPVEHDFGLLEVAAGVFINQH